MSPRSHYPESATATRSLCGLYDAAGDSDPRLVDRGATCLSCQRIENIYAARARESTEVSGVGEAGQVSNAADMPPMVELLLLATAAILVVAVIGALLRRVARRRRPSRVQLLRDAVGASLSSALARVRER